MKCARCNRELDKPALLIGSTAIGPKCVKLMGLSIDKFRFSERVRFAIKASHADKPSKDQIGLFDDDNLHTQG
jgi:hypothetical protein